MRSPRGNHGCSLIEVLIATTILAVGVASLAQLFTLAIASNLDAGRRTRAVMLASQKVEEIRSLDWDVTLQRGGDRVGEFTRQWSVEPLSGNPENAALVDVVVMWNQSPVGRLVTVRSRRVAMTTQP
jgi:prepilin-type N-terminal cleavage/methylation domain-containing protein